MRRKKTNRNVYVDTMEDKKCKVCEKALSENILENYVFQEYGLYSAKIIKCPYCENKQSIGYLLDKQYHFL